MSDKPFLKIVTFVADRDDDLRRAEKEIHQLMEAGWHLVRASGGQGGDLSAVVLERPRTSCC